MQKKCVMHRKEMGKKGAVPINHTIPNIKMDKLNCQIKQIEYDYSTDDTKV